MTSPIATPAAGCLVQTHVSGASWLCGTGRICLAVFAVLHAHRHKSRLRKRFVLVERVLLMKHRRRRH